MSVKQALSKMVEIMSKDAAHAGKLLAIAHCNCLERAFQLKEMVRKSCHFSDILITETGGISTVYANDGGIVVAYCSFFFYRWPGGFLRRAACYFIAGVV